MTNTEEATSLICVDDSVFVDITCWEMLNFVEACVVLALRCSVPVTVAGKQATIAIARNGVIVQACILKDSGCLSVITEKRR